jgi:circadian clock protein KaiC
MSPSAPPTEGQGRAGARTPAQIPTGIEGLDNVLFGGLPSNRLYLVQGDPGLGKTTLALEFLLEGVRRGERVLYITLSETREELEAVAQSHGWSLEGVALHDLSLVEKTLAADANQTVYHHAEVELNELAKVLLDRVTEVGPTRVVFDSLSELRLMSGDPFRFRRQILALKQFFVGRECTVLLLDDRTTDASDQQLQSLAHGVITLDRQASEFGSARRRLVVQKLRGLRFREGYHDYAIGTGGITVYPRLHAAEHRVEPPNELVKSGNDALDTLLGGGLFRGSSVVLIGPAGVGKSTVGVQYVAHAATQGKRSAVYLFDERVRTASSSTAAKRLQPYIQNGLVHLQQVDPAELSPGEFSHRVRRAVERDGAEFVVIDGLNGYLAAMPGERHLVLQLHELLTYLGQKGVTTFLMVAQHGMFGSMASPVDVSYLADAVILFRYFEFRGSVRQALSVFKRRGGDHERTIRELRITEDGVRIGEPLHSFRGVLTGVPSYEGAEAPKDAR